MPRLSADRLATRRDFATNRHEHCGLVGTLSKGKKYGLLIRCEEAVDEGILLENRRKMCCFFATPPTRLHIEGRAALPYIPPVCSYQSLHSSPPRRQIDQYSFAKTKIAYQTLFLAERLQHRPNDDRAGGDDFFTAFFEPWQADAVCFLAAQ